MHLHTTSRPTEFRVPGLVVDVELTEPLQSLPAVGPDGRRPDNVWLLVRLAGEPLGMLVRPMPDTGLTVADIERTVDADLGDAIRARRAGGADRAFLAERQAVLGTAEPITVVICTRDRPDRLARCLDSVLAQQHPAFRVLVVDNAPATDTTRDLVVDKATDLVRYVREARPGLSWARNRAIDEVETDIIAWIDDDEVADEHWLAEIARAFHRHPEAGAVAGVIVPAELETPPQDWFEQFGGHSKGRGFAPAVHSPTSSATQSPLYPLPAFGAGGNMAYRRSALRLIGGFDTALGAGTKAMGGEDTLAFTQLLLAGGTLVYQPSAVVRHYHRRDLAGLAQQMRGYGVGLTAYYTSLLMRDPRLFVPLLRLVPTAMRDLLGGGLRTGGIRPGFPRRLLKVNQRGMLRGPWAYLRARRTARRLGRSVAR